MTEREPRGPAFWVATTTALLAVCALALGVTTPPRSGAFCGGTCVPYPYTDVAAFVPRDYWWMYPGLLLALAFVVLTAWLRHRAAPDRAAPATAAVCLAAIGAAVLVVDYGVQLTVVQPALLAGQTDGLSLWSQYNPHGLFIGLENIGYAVLAAAMLSLGIALRGAGSPVAVGRVFTAAGTLSLTALVAIAATYRADLDVRYEVAGLLVTWLAIAAAGTVLAVEAARSR